LVRKNEINTQLTDEKDEDEIIEMVVMMSIETMVEVVVLFLIDTAMH
jgi:hypothetical protein